MSHHFRVNPWAMGLLGGIAGFANDYGQYARQQRELGARLKAYEVKYKSMQDTAQMRSLFGAQLKQLQLEANQRAYTVHQTDDKGQAWDVSMRNVFDSDSGKWKATEIGRTKSKDPLAPVSLREDRADARQAKALAAKNDPSVETAAERRNKVQQLGENKRAADKAAAQDVKDYRQAYDKDRAAILQEYGIAPGDPNAISKLRDASYQKHLGQLAGDEAKPQQPVQSSAHPNMTPDGRPIKYGPDGTPYIKGPEGKPVPYVADASGNPNSPLALDQPLDDEKTDTSSATADAAQPEGQGLLADDADKDEQSDEDQDSKVAQSDDKESPDEPDDDEDNQGLMGGRQFA